MHLTGGSLSLGTQNDDVTVLQRELVLVGYPIDPAEIEAKIYGNTTQQAVQDFQRQHGLDPTGVVDEATARLLTSAVAALQAPDFIVRGQIRLQNGDPLPPATMITIRAFDKDLRHEQLLAQVQRNSDAVYDYEIRYGAGQFRRAEKQHADLIVRAFDDHETLLGASDLLFNAPAIATVDLIIAPPLERTLSEYEHLMEALSPLLDGIALTALTDSDLDFLFGESGLDRQWLDFLRHAAALSLDSGLPTEVFYAWARTSLPLDLARLLAVAPDVLRQALEAAIAQHIAPATLREQLDWIMQRLQQLRFEHGFLQAHALRGRLQKLERPVVGFTVRGFDQDHERELGYDISDSQGYFSLTYTAPRADTSTRNIQLRILDRHGTQLYQTDLALQLGSDKTIEIAIPAEAIPDRPSPTMTQLSATLGLEISESLLTALAERGIHTLADLRAASGQRRLQGLPVEPELLRTLEAHANLSMISTDLHTTAALIKRGYPNLINIARTSITAFVADNTQAFGDFQSALFHVTASSLVNGLEGAAMEVMSGNANDYGFEYIDTNDNPSPVIAEAKPSVFYSHCDCDDCEGALSPLAYLADLLDYTLAHVEEYWSLIDLPFLTGTFHQPFGDLPTSCEDVDRQVRQVRLCIEALRGQLAATNHTLPAKALDEYLQHAYSSLLTHIGTSYEEIRLAQTAGLPERQTLADRLGLDLDPLQQTHLAQLLLYPTGQNAQTLLNEQRLEQLFGLIDTTRDPLSEGVKLGDLSNLIARWSLRGINWSRNTDPDGFIYVTISQPQQSHGKVELFRDPQRTDLVASGSGPFAQSIAVNEKKMSGLSGSFNLNWAVANQAIKICAVPNVLSWRLQHQRTLWQQQDWPADPYTAGRSVAALKQLPPALQFPAPLPGTINFGATTQLLVYDGVMSDGDLSALLAASDEPAYTKAIKQLYQRSQRLPIVDPDVIGIDDLYLPFAKANAADPDRAIDLWLKRRQWVDAGLQELFAFRKTTSSKASLKSLPAALQFPQPLQNAIHFEPAYETLIFAGVMATADYDLLLTLSAESDYQEAVQELFQASQQPPFDLPDLAALLASMSIPATYEGTTVVPWTSPPSSQAFDELAQRLAGGPDREDAALEIQSELKLTVESFNRLIEIRNKDQLAAIDLQSHPVEPKEWDELFSILLQARKVSLFPTWYAEERAIELPFDPTNFWISLREPVEGAWPPPLTTPLQRPLIDPEALKQDDLPEALAGLQARGLWQARQARLTEISKELKTAHEDGGMDALLRWALGEPSFTDALPLPPGISLDTLLSDLGSIDQNTANTAAETVTTALHLSVENFTHLISLLDKVQPAGADWTEVYTLLTTAQKEHREFPLWIAQEQQAGLVAEYWWALKASLPRWRASAETRYFWLQTLRTHSMAPLIDPDLLIRDDFTYPFITDPAYRLHQERATWLGVQLTALASAPTSLAGFDSLVVETFIGGDVVAGIHAALHAMRVASGLESVLLLLWGRPLPDLDMLLADLSSNSAVVVAEANKSITATLYLPTNNFVALMAVRAKEITAQPITAAEWELVENILAPAAAIQSIFGLGAEEQAGVDISARLDQLLLPRDAFAYLLRARNLLAAQATLLASEWEELHAILVQIRKVRVFGEWKQAERDEKLLLAPDNFQIPPPVPAQFPPKPVAPLPIWRASWSARHDWQERLQTRIEQVDSHIEGFRGVIDGAETAVLPMLRDALILASNAKGSGLVAKATTIGEMLLIDAKTSACQMTTRVAQAIDTLQSLLSLVHGSLLTAYPYLSLHAHNFDEEWKWLGSYNTWRAAMFVFLYPENILLPSLRKVERQTPVFSDLVAELRSNRRFDPEAACQAARTYADYFRDLCNLSVEATCRAWARTVTPDCTSGHNGPAYRRYDFFFARNPATNAYYFSTVDLDDDSPYNQSFWQRIDGTDLATFKARRILGAALYERDSANRSIYLFVETFKQGYGIGFITYDLEKLEWKEELVELSLNMPPKRTFVSVVVGQTSQVWAPPTLFVDTTRPINQLEVMHIYYMRSLNSEGTGWMAASADAENEWDSFEYYYDEDFNVHTDTDDIDIFFHYNSYKLLQAIQVWNSTQGYWSWMLVVFGGLQNELVVVRVVSDYLKRWEPSIGRLGASGATYPHDAIMLFGLDSSLLPRRQRVREDQDDAVPVTDSSVPYISHLTQVVPDSGTEWEKDDQRRLVHYLTPPQSSESKRRAYYIVFDTADTGPGQSENWTELSRALIAPVMGDIGVEPPPFAFELGTGLSSAQLQEKRETIASWYPLNVTSNGSATPLTYLQEAYYFVPMQIAFQLQKNGFYQEALEWFRTVYDYTAPIADAKIFLGLVEEHQLPLLSPRTDEWLLDPLDPHAIAASRRDTYSRYTILSIVRCLLEYADAEFTLDTVESVSRARSLYLAALRLLDRPEVKKNPNACKELIVTLDDIINDPWYLGAITDILSGMNDIVQMSYAAQQIQFSLANGGDFEQALTIVNEIKATLPPAPSLGELVAGKADFMQQAHSALLAVPEVAEQAYRLGLKVANSYQQAVSRFTGLSDAQLGTAVLPWLHWSPEPDPGANPIQFDQDAVYGHVVPSDSLTPELIYYPPTYIPAAPYHFCIPKNPIPEALRLWAELNLFKIRNCRNIAGMERQLDPYAAPTNTTSGLPYIGIDDQLLLPSIAKLAPTAYRYPLLIERAKQMVALSQQIEATYLSTLEKADAERYGILKARQDIRLTRSAIHLQTLRVVEAESGVQLATLQQQRAQVQIDYYDALIEEGDSILESAALAFQIVSLLAPESVTTGPIPSVSFSPSGKLQTFANILSTYASFERREQDWAYQKSLAQQDVVIGEQNIKVAQEHVRVVGQERVIAEMQAEHAEAVADFIQNKFTNVDLYDWMSEVLEGVYSFFLQQATAVAQLAANQLAFERQEIPPPFIQTDYWEAANEQGISSLDSKTPDRRGLTGSARLLHDIYQLEQYAFETNKRKLQLTKTISLAQFPAEFQRFRETGILNFATPMELFDRDFPGHYLRLIRRVRTSVVALVPPNQGIRATLSTNGISRVVIGGDIFQAVVLNAGQQSVALSSPREATGLFELDPQPEMMLPFEGMGVATNWEFRMLKASNFLDYRTIADVLVTIEYNAFHSYIYYQQVIQSLKATVSGDRAFSFRHQFADQWYDLHNPEQTATPMTVRFTTLQDDLPPNLIKPKIGQVAIYFARADGQLFEVPVAALRFTETGTSTFVGGSASSIDGMISTRRGNASSWMAMIGKAPVGEWELALPDTIQLRNRFKQGEIDDILFVLTYNGRTPEWPN